MIKNNQMWVYHQLFNTLTLAHSCHYAHKHIFRLSSQNLDKPENLWKEHRKTLFQRPEQTRWSFQ